MLYYHIRSLLIGKVYSSDALVMVLGIKLVSYRIQSTVWNLILSIVLGIAIYMTLCVVFKVKEFNLILSLLKHKLKKPAKT